MLAVPPVMAVNSDPRKHYLHRRSQPNQLLGFEMQSAASVYKGMARMQTNKTGPGLRAFDAWLRELGRSPNTGYRWRKRGWIKTLNIGGRCYITDDEIKRFISRGENAEFFRRTLVKATTAEIKKSIQAQFKKGGGS
jgi:hypothetical protein